MRQAREAWATAKLPQWADDPSLWGAVSVVSLVLLGASALALPWLLCRVPAGLLRATPQKPRSLPLAILRNLLGLVWLLLGLVMLVTPGQGLLTIMAALLVLDYPGKRRLLRHLLGRPRLLGGINRIRTRRGYPPLEAPDP